MSNNRTSSQTQRARKRRNAKDSPLAKTAKPFLIPGTFCWASNAGGDIRRLGFPRKSARRPFGLSTPAASQSNPRSNHQEWWSRTGSNRRPEACKATALPTELRPHLGKGLQPLRPAAKLPKGRTAAANFFANPKIKWWAWDDSNVRPHPYQGCALTT